MISKSKKTNIGKTIALLRKKSGYTQKSLADKLFISDKAVSKWERGLSYPDVTFINKLSKILDIDTDALFIEEDKSIASNWSGLLYYPNNRTNVKFDNKVGNRYVLEIIICYYLLASISNIFIVCDGDNCKFAKEYIKRISVYNIKVNVYDSKCFLLNCRSIISKNITNIMLIYDLFFIYGVGLTSSFQRAMLDKSKTISISNPRIPLLFGPKKIVLNAINRSKYLDNATPLNLFRGYLNINLNSPKGVKECSKLMKSIEKFSGNTLYDINEIAKVRNLL